MVSDLGFLEDYLGQEENVVPAGGDFSPMGLIAPWRGGFVFRLSNVSSDLGAIPGVKFDQTGVDKNGQHWYVFKDKESADRAKELASEAYGPDTYWRFETPNTEVMNFKDESVRGKFSEVIVYQVNIKTPASKKHRHVFHLVSLPYAVQAVALLQGFLKESVFHANELLMPSRDNEPEKFTGEFQNQIIGPDGGVDEMLNSVLGQRRAELWKALGEEKAINYMLSGSRYVAQSPNLRAALSIVHRTWTKPIYAEVISFLDPRLDAVTGEAGNRLRIPALTRIFKTQAEARAEADRQMAESSAKEGGEPATTRPPVPAEWDTILPEWVKAVKEAVTALNGKLPEKLKDKAALAAELSAEFGEIEAWAKHLGLVK